MAEILRSDEAKWNLVIEAVYGSEAPASCSIVDGKITFSASPRPYSAKPNLKFLSDVLRSDEPIPAIAREWLADLFDPDGDSEYWAPRTMRFQAGAGRLTGMRETFARISSRTVA